MHAHFEFPRHFCRSLKHRVRLAHGNSWVGIVDTVDTSPDDIRAKATLTVTGNTRTIRGEDRKFFSVATAGE
jgi:hypothetical protein